MASTVTIPIQGASAAVIVPLAATGSTMTGVHSTLDIMQFDSLGAGSKAVIAAPAGAADAASSPNIDWNRADGATVRATGVNLIVSAEDGSDITSEGSGGTPTHPTVTLVINDGPSNHSDYATWKAFIAALAQLFDVPSLVVLAIGRDIGGSVTNPGFFACVGKLTSEIDLGQDGNAAKTLTLTLTAMSGVSFDAGLVTTLTAGGYLPTITPTQGAAVDFPNLSSGNLTSIEDDQYVIV